MGFTKSVPVIQRDDASSDRLSRGDGKAFSFSKFSSCPALLTLPSASVCLLTERETATLVFDGPIVLENSKNRTPRAFLRRF